MPTFPTKIRNLLPVLPDKARLKELPLTLVKRYHAQITPELAASDYLYDADIIVGQTNPASRPMVRCSKSEPRGTWRYSPLGPTYVKNIRYGGKPYPRPIMPLDPMASMPANYADGTKVSYESDLVYSM